MEHKQYNNNMSEFEEKKQKIQDFEIIDAIDGKEIKKNEYANQ